MIVGCYHVIEAAREDRQEIILDEDALDHIEEGFRSWLRDVDGEYHGLLFKSALDLLEVRADVKANEMTIAELQVESICLLEESWLESLFVSADFRD